MILDYELYFATDYETEAVLTGAMWLLLSQLGWGVLESAHWISGEEDVSEWSAWAFIINLWGNESIFLTMFIFFLLAFIRTEGSDREWQKIYYRVIQYLTPVSWAATIASTVFFVIGVIDGDGPGVLLYGLAFLACYFLFGALAYYAWGPDAAKFYLWTLQDYYNDDDNWWGSF